MQNGKVATTSQISRAFAACTSQPNYYSFKKRCQLAAEKIDWRAFDVGTNRELNDAFELNLKSRSEKERARAVSYAETDLPIPGFEYLLETKRRIVHTGGADISTDGRVLQSSGFKDCTGLLLKNENNGSPALFHNNDEFITGERGMVLGDFAMAYLSGLSQLGDRTRRALAGVIESFARGEYFAKEGLMDLQAFEKIMSRLNLDGALHGRFIYGKAGMSLYTYSMMNETLKYFGIRLDADIYVPSMELDIAYHPKESKLAINNRSQKLVLEYKY